jgi:hypothetical protein
MSFCTHCGRGVAESHRFCGHCGAEAQPSPQSGDINLSSTLFQQGSILRSGTDSDADEGAAREGSKWSALAVGAVVVVVMVGAWTGYQLFSRADAPDVSSGLVRETEQTINPNPPSAGLAGGSSGTGAPLWEVGSSTHDVKDAGDGVGTPDGRSVVVMPGGALALSYRAEFFYNGEGPDVRIYGPAGEQAAYVLFIRADAGGTWIRVDANRRGFLGGAASHDFGHHAIERGREIMIRNDAASALHIDAVLPLHPEAELHHDEPKAEAPHH